MTAVPHPRPGSYYEFMSFVFSAYLALSTIFLGFLANHLYTILKINPPDVPEQAKANFFGAGEYGLGPLIPSIFSYSAFSEQEAHSFALMLVTGNLVMVVMTLRRLIQSHREYNVLVAFEQSEEAKYAKIALNVWDHSIIKAEQVEDAKQNKGRRLFQEVRGWLVVLSLSPPPLAAS